MAISHKLVGLAVVGALIMGVGVIKYQKEETVEVAAPVTLSASYSEFPYFEEVAKAAKKEAAKAHIEMDLINAYSNPFSQLNSLVDARDAGTKAVILEPLTPDSASVAVEILGQGDVPVVSLGCYPSLSKVVSCVTPDYEAAGGQAADVLAKAIGESGSVVFYKGLESPLFVPELRRGFREGLAKYPDMKIIDGYTDSEGKVWPVSYPGDLQKITAENPDVKAVFSFDDRIKGILETLGDKAGSDIQVLGFGGSPDLFGAIKSGKVLGALDPQGELVGEEAMKQVELILQGKTPQSEKRIDVLMIDSSNVNEFE